MSDTTTKQNYVYLIHAETTRFVKIGVSNNPTARLKEVQTGCPFRCYVHTELPVSKGRAEETALHALFKSARRNGEWFELPIDTSLPLLLDLIKLALRHPREFEVRFPHAATSRPQTHTADPNRKTVYICNKQYKLTPRDQRSWKLRHAGPMDPKVRDICTLSNEEADTILCSLGDAEKEATQVNILLIQKGKRLSLRAVN